MSSLKANLHSALHVAGKALYELKDNNTIQRIGARMKCAKLSAHTTVYHAKLHAKTTAYQAKLRAKNTAYSTKHAVGNFTRHAKKITYDATLQMIKAGAFTAQGALAAAGAAGKVTKEVASRTGQVARNVKSACSAALGQLATQIKSRQDEPENYRYVEPEGFYREASNFRSDCVRAIGDMGQQCKIDGDANAAYSTFYSHADYLFQQTQQVLLVDHQELLFIARLYLDSISTLRKHQQAKDTAAFTTVIFSMQEQVLRWDPQQECRASFD